jgi:hypothetical protein
MRARVPGTGLQHLLINHTDGEHLLPGSCLECMDGSTTSSRARRTHPPATLGPRFVFGGITSDDVGPYEPATFCPFDQVKRDRTPPGLDVVVRTAVRTNHCLPACPHTAKTGRRIPFPARSGATRAPDNQCGLGRAQSRRYSSLCTANHEPGRVARNGSSGAAS